jgi:hypothetical protein
MSKWLVRGAALAAAGALGWVACYVAALLVLHTYRPEPIDITLTEDDDE